MSDIKIVRNKLLGGWFVVRGPHQFPLSGKFATKADALSWLLKRQEARERSARWIKELEA